MTDKILLDKNIVLDLILGRDRQDKVKLILKEFAELFISTHTFTTCFYILRKSKIPKEQIYKDLSIFELLEISKIDCHLAFGIAKNLDDIEDCLEICTAKRNRIKILTADQKMVQEYSNFADIIVV